MSVVLITVGVLGLLAALNPLRPVVFLLVLGTDRAHDNGVYFLLGWATALTVVFTAVFVAFDSGAGGRASSDQRTWLSAAEILVGVALLVVSARKWRQRHDLTGRSVPTTVMRRLAGLNPRQAGMLGIAIQPRALTLAAAVVVARDRTNVISGVGGLGVFALLSTAALIALFVYYLRRPDVASGQFGILAIRIENASPTILPVLCGLAAMYLLFDATHSLITQ